MVPSAHPKVFAVLIVLNSSCHVTAQALADPVDHPLIAFESADFCEDGPWHLVYEDEFNDDTLDTDHWLRFFPYCINGDECQVSRKHGGEDELQIFEDANVQFTGNGIVKLIVKRSDTLVYCYSYSSHYTAALLHSRMKFHRGRFECRCKVPYSNSNWIWPSFWLFGGPGACSEIDILEIPGDRSDRYHHALHRYNYECNGNHANDEDTHTLMDLSNDFHVYRADWDKWFINFYVDDQLIYRSCRIYDLLDRPVSSCYIHEGVYIQNQAFPAQDAYMSIIVGVGIHNSGLNDAHGPGPPVPNIPCALEVDWIRVYQR